jgi:predicted AAA+ superfamily ATPase
MYFIYNDLSAQKGINKDIAGEYVNESFERLSDLISSNQKKIDELYKWVKTNLEGDVENEYSNIDFVVYENKITNLERILETKTQIKSLLLSTKKENIQESVNIPLSSMLKIVTNTFNKEYSNISEEDKKELKSLLSLNKKQISEEIKLVKENVILKLSDKIAESDDSELKEKIGNTIQKIQESESDLISLYKLKQLEQGL